jgi:hypothetical protein
MGEAMQDLPRRVVVEIDPPIAEWRLVRAVAAARGTTTAGLVRQLLTEELGRHHITPDQIPWLAREIPLRVRRRPRR